MNRRTVLLGAAIAMGLATAASAEVVTVQSVRENTLATLQPDVTYTDIANGFARSHLKMDLLRPVSTTPTPAIVFVSGNGWRSVDKAALIPQLAPFAKAGYLVAAIEYRIIGEATFPEPLKDVKTAIRFLRANATRYNINPDRIGIWGNSAGGQLAAMAAVTGDMPEFGNDKWPGHSSAVQAVATWYGAFDLSTTTGQAPDSYLYVENAHMGFNVRDPANADKVRKANPQTYISPTTPPFMLVHGTDDPQVPFRQSEMMHDSLKAANIEATLIRVQGAGHSFGQVSSNPEVMSAMQAFFDKQLKGQ
jgi:acetyl esterase/lipase